MDSNSVETKEVEEHAVERVKFMLRRKVNCEDVNSQYNDKTFIHDGDFTFKDRRFFLQVKGSSENIKQIPSVNKKYIRDASINLLVYFHVINIDLEDKNTGDVFYKIFDKELILTMAKNGNNSISFKKAGFTLLNEEGVGEFQQDLLEYYEDNGARRTIRIDELFNDDKSKNMVVTRDELNSPVSLKSEANLKKIRENDDGFSLPIHVKEFVVNDFSFKNADFKKKNVMSFAQFKKKILKGVALIELPFEDKVEYLHPKGFFKIILEFDRENIDNITYNLKFSFNPFYVDEYKKIVEIIKNERIDESFFIEVENFILKLEILKEVVDAFFNDSVDKILDIEDYEFIFNFIENKNRDTEGSTFKIVTNSNGKKLLLTTINDERHIVDKKTRLKCINNEKEYFGDFSIFPIFSIIPLSFFECINFNYTYTLNSNLEFLMENSDVNYTSFFFNYLFYLYQIQNIEVAKDIYNVITESHFFKEKKAVDEITITINILQIKLLFCELEEDDVEILKDILEKNSDDIETNIIIHFCISVLFNDKCRANHYFNSLDDESQNEVKKWPIYIKFNQMT